MENHLDAAAVNLAIKKKNWSKKSASESLLTYSGQELYSVCKVNGSGEAQNINTIQVGWYLSAFAANLNEAVCKICWCSVQFRSGSSSRTHGTQCAVEVSVQSCASCFCRS